MRVAMPDVLAAALTRIDARAVRATAADRLMKVIARQRRELAAEAALPPDRKP